LRGVAPGRAQVSVADRLAGDEPVHHGLVERIAELHHDVIDHLGHPRIGQHAEHVMVVLQAVRLSEADEPAGLEGLPGPRR